MKRTIKLLALIVLGLVALFLGTRLANGISQNPGSNSVNNALSLGQRVQKYFFGIKHANRGGFAPRKEDYRLPESPELKEWLDSLGKMENCPSTGMIDSNNKKSYSLFCFQEDTFVHFVERYDMLPNLKEEEQEIMNWISDPSFQREVVKKMIAENPKNALHWRTSVVKKKLGLPPI